MNPATRYTVCELLAIIVGALAVNAYLVHRDHEQAAQIEAKARAAQPLRCGQAAEREECEP